MKLTIFIMTLFLLQVSAATKAQITLNTKQESLLKVLDKISKQSGYDLICTVQDFKNANPVTIKLNNVSVEQALKEAFAGQPLVYEVSGTTMMVKKKEEKEASIIDRIKNYLASITIAGTLQDEKGVSLPGVNVKIKNGKGNTLTGTKGEFILKNVEEGAIVEFSYVGYKKKELPAEELMGIIRMELSDNKLDEVQIQFSGTTSRRTSTSNIATIKAEDIAKQPVDNPLYALMGRVPGLIVTPSSGGFNAPVKVQLRGQNSLSTIESEPLFVIDGVPFLNNIGGSDGFTSSVSAMSFINPSDIESIDVLKDADATAIYGSRGANGVVLITTKKGHAGVTQVNANINVGFSDVSTRRVRMMNTEQYLQMRKEAFTNDGLAIPDVNIPGGEKNGSNFDLTVWSQNRYTDWQKELLNNTGYNQQANVSISGGNDLVRYALGGTYTSTSLPNLGNNNQKMGTGNFNINGNSTDRRFRLSLSGSYSENLAINATDITSDAFKLPPNAPILKNGDGSINWEPNSGSDAGEATWENPLAKLLRTSTSNTATINSSANLSYDITKKIKLSLLAGFNKVNNSRKYITPISSLDPAFSSSNTGSALTGESKSTNWSFQPQISYLNTLGLGKLDVLIGGSLQKGALSDQSISAIGYINDALLGSLMAAGGVNGYNSGFQYKYAGFFCRANYNWNDRYVINLSARRDGSSRFGPGHQFGNFGSVGTAWIFSNENFLKTMKEVLSFGKIRASYGVNGNDQIGDYRYLELFSPGDNYQGSPVLGSSGATNPDYHWEHKTSWELGVDLGFFKDRLLVSASYFKSIAGDQLLFYPLPATAGGNIILNQDAKIQNTGMEMSISSTNIATEKFHWTTTANLSFANRNKILALPSDANAFQSRLSNLYDSTKPIADLIGQPFGGLVAVYEYRGIDPETGIASFADKNGNTVVGDGYAYAKYINLNPSYYGGLSNQFRYKGFTLDIFLEFKKQVGKSIYTNEFISTAGQVGILPVELMNRWQKPGDVASFQKFSQNYSTSYSGILMGSSDLAYTDASYLRIKNVALSFELPEKIKEKIRVKNLNVFINAQNLWTITGYKGADPEAQSWVVLPPLRTIQTGIRLGF